MRAKETACNVTLELGTIIKGDAKKFIQVRQFLKSGPDNVLFKILCYEDPSASLNWLFSSKTAPKDRY